MERKTGQCLCGAVTFSADVAAEIQACHCTQCQRWTGGGPGGERGAAAAQVALVTLRGGETLELEQTGDLGAGNAGMLVFSEGLEQPEYVRWDDVARVEFN